MAPILQIFRRINEHGPTGQLLVGSNALWPTRPTLQRPHASGFSEERRRNMNNHKKKKSTMSRDHFRTENVKPTDSKKFFTPE